MHRTISILAIIAVSSAAIAEEKATSSHREAIIDVELDELALEIDRKAKFTLNNAPENIRQLHDRRIRLRGYMYPTFKQTGVTRFILNGETKQKAYHFAGDLNRVPIHYYIPVTLRKGTSTEYSLKPLSVEGQMRLQPDIVDGVIRFVYKLDDAIVTPTKATPGFHASIGFG